MANEIKKAAELLLKAIPPENNGNFGAPILPAALRPTVRVAQGDDLERRGSPTPPAPLRPAAPPQQQKPPQRPQSQPSK